MRKISIILLLMFVVVGCDKDDGNGDVVNPVEYPIEVPFEEYLLKETSRCQWTNIEMEQNYPPDPADSSKLLLINSDDELKEYIECFNGDAYPEIDFSKKTLVLACGTFFQGVDTTISKLLQLSANEYQLDVEVDGNSAGVIELWTAELIVNKLSKESNFKLNVTIK